MSDWYKVTAKACCHGYCIINIYKDFNDIGGSNTGSSLASLLADVYTDYEWLPWKFPTVVRGFWANKDNHKKFVETVAKELKIKNMEMW